MANITVSVDDVTYHRARVVAAERGASVSGLVRDFLVSLAPSRLEQNRQREVALRAQIVDFDSADRQDRNEVHRRGL